MCVFVPHERNSRWTLKICERKFFVDFFFQWKEAASFMAKIHSDGISSIFARAFKKSLKNWIRSNKSAQIRWADKSIVSSHNGNFIKNSDLLKNSIDFCAICARFECVYDNFVVWLNIDFFWCVEMKHNTKNICKCAIVTPPFPQINEFYAKNGNAEKLMSELWFRLNADWILLGNYEYMF